MNRQERRAISQDKQRIVVTGIVVNFANGQHTRLDTGKVMVVDKDTGRPLFEEVLDSQATDEPTTPRQEFAGEPDKHSYSVEFDTPEGRMVYVKKGNWSGVKPA